MPVRKNKDQMVAENKLICFGQENHPFTPRQALSVSGKEIVGPTGCLIYCNQKPDSDQHCMVNGCICDKPSSRPLTDL